MGSLSETLLEKHVQHELQKLTSDSLKTDLANEIEAFFDKGADVKLQDLLDSKQVVASVHTLASIELDIEGLIKKLVKAFYEDKSHEKFSINDLISRSEIDAIVDQVMELDDLRQEIIQMALKSKLSNEIISDILYSGISRYIEQTNALTKKVPGAKAVMSMGKGFISKAAPRLEEQLEKQIKRYIRIAMPEILSQSEKFISGSMNEDNIKEIVSEVWDHLEDQSLADIREYIALEDIEELSLLIYEQVKNRESSPYIDAMIETFVKAFYKQYGNKRIEVLIEDLGLTKEIIESLLDTVLPSAIEGLMKDNYLEERIRHRLSSFYNDPEISKLIES